MQTKTHLSVNLAFTLLLTALGPQAANPPHAHVILAGHKFSVEIASTEAARERGLMYRARLAADDGMLFVYAHAQPRYFWMKDTLIPLDILFFDAEKRLINVSANTPPCRTDPCPTYASTEPAKYVLELNAGIANRLGIKTGDTFKLN